MLELTPAPDIPEATRVAVLERRLVERDALIDWQHRELERLRAELAALREERSAP